MLPKPPGNLLLARIPWADYPELKNRFKRVRLDQKQVLYEARSPIDYAYFPNSGTTSSVVVMYTGDMVEVATVGNEGEVGLPTMNAGGRSPNRVFIQLPGEAMRIETAVLRKVLNENASLSKLLGNYADAFSFQVSQS